MSMRSAKRTSFSCATRNMASAAASMRAVPVLPGIAEDACCPGENIKSSATMDVWRRTRGSECEVLGTKGDDMDIWKLQQTACVRVRTRREVT